MSEQRSTSSLLEDGFFHEAGRYCFESNYGSTGQNCILHTLFVAPSIIVSTILRSSFSRERGEKVRYTGKRTIDVDLVERIK